MRRLKRIFTVVAMLIMAISANAWPWLSPYAYCMNNPVKFIDPDGRKIVLAENSSEDFIKQFNNAFNYLQSHNAAGVWMSLDARPEIITIYEYSNKANYTKGDEIHWNSYSGLYTFSGSEGHKLSPAIRLLYEMGHKLQELTDIYDTNDNGSVWHSNEEKRNILDVETPAAIACGEIPSGSISRDSHSGVAFETESSSSTKVLNPDDNVKLMIECWE